MSKGTLVRAWAGLHLVAGVGLAVVAWGLAPVDASGWKVVAAGVVLLAWTAIGLLGVALAMAGRDANRTARSARHAAREAHREARALQDRAHALDDDVRSVAARVEADQGAAREHLADTRQAVRVGLEEIGQRLDHIETALEQLGLDTSRGLSAEAVRLDEALDRLRGGDGPEGEG